MLAPPAHRVETNSKVGMAASLPPLKLRHGTLAQYDPGSR